MMTMEHPRLFFLITLLAAAVSGKFQVQSPDSKQVVEVGSDAILQCSLSPPLGPAGLQVHWFRSMFYSTVFLMKNGKKEKDQQSTEYVGRASLRNGTGSAELTLLLRNVTLKDADTYHCFVEDIASENSDEAVIDLLVIGSGSLPIMSVSLKDGVIMVSFYSSDWFPRPEMRWELEGVPVIADTSETISNQSNGLFTLESRVLLKKPSHQRLYGAVRHPVTGKSTGLYMTISEEMFPRLSSWAFAFLFLISLSLVGAAFMLFLITRERTQKDEFQKRNGELSSEVDWRKAVMSPDFITFSPETAHPELSVTEDFQTLMNQPPPDMPTPSDARFETERCCLGLPAFTQGCHYWEVEVGDGLEWAVGVASPKLQRRSDAYMFRPQALIWCISRFTEALKALDAQESSLPIVGGTLQKVGVYLNLSGPRTLTFYDPRTWDMLYSFTDVGRERESVLPFFWLGRNGGAMRLKR
ncbi:butyrophilin subfamily 1 member A1-like isoform X3 [Rana temporaria]|nr:butyrophilin subfamily 1 member A1-like isoform X2 [Rana temporaria]XP_040180935.1 butyrophilin subfamily 1 member A1-like isoform X3 [Rana temporaria]